MSDPSTIGPKTVAAYLGILYGIIGRLFISLLRRKLFMCAYSNEEYQVKPARPVASFIISLILFQGLIVLAILAGGASVIVFLHIPSITIIGVGSVFVALFFSQPGALIDSLKLAFSSGEISTREAEGALKSLTQLRDSAVTMVILVSMVGLICLPPAMWGDHARIGPMMALMLISMLYGIFLTAFFQGLNNNVHRKLVSMKEEVEVLPIFSDTFLILFSSAIPVLSLTTLLLISVL